MKRSPYLHYLRICQRSFPIYFCYISCTFVRRVHWGFSRLKRIAKIYTEVNQTKKPVDVYSYWFAYGFKI